MKAPFPLEKITDIEQSPDDYRLLERIPCTREKALFPFVCTPAVGDEKTLLVIDVETTGLSKSDDAIIELGVVRVAYSPSRQQITSILDADSQFNDPGVPIPEQVTQITGISSDDVKGHQIDQDAVSDLLKDDPIVLAHNAAFDRAFFDRTFPQHQQLRWGCTLKEIPWRELGLGSGKLDYLLLSHGWFFDAHRASTDCLAVAWLLAQRPDALSYLLDSMAEPTVTVSAVGAPFSVKDTLKGRGYRWFPGAAGQPKCWWRQIPESDLPEERAFLDELYPNGAEAAAYDYQDARSRYITR